MRDASCGRGLFAWARPTSPRRGAYFGRRLYESQPRSSRLSPDAGGLSCCQAASIHRADRAGRRSRAPIFVDYAHKPDALAKALEALRPYASGRLVVVFGCGGDRDAGKRPMMGAIAAKLADRVVVTDDNPRSEDPAAIRAAILKAAPGALEIGDRREAIYRSIADLRRGDVLLIAGKGHETGQIIGKHVLPFSDHEAVAAALAGRVA